MGREPLDLLLAFVRSIFQAKIEKLPFMGQLSPAIALVVLLGFFYLLRRGEDHLRLCGALVIAIIWWSIGPHWDSPYVAISPTALLLGGQSFSHQRHICAGVLAGLSLKSQAHWPVLVADITFNCRSSH